MALQTKDFSVSGKSGSGRITYTYTLRVTEESVDAVKNSSRVTIQAILQQTYSGTAFSGYRTGVSCELDGQSVFSDYCRRSISGKQEHIYYTWEGELPHREDGTLTVTVTGRLWQTKEATYTPPTLEITDGAWTLTPISRASTVGVSDGFIGSRTTLVITPAAEGCSHTLGYTFGEESGYISREGTVSKTPERMTDTAVSFLIPESFYAQIPDAPWGECQILCTTYREETELGSREAVFRVTAREELCSPLVQCTARDVNPATLALTGDPGVLVRYMSTLGCTVDAQGVAGAQIIRRQIGNTLLTEDFLEIPRAESGQILATAQDSRGYTGQHSLELPMIPYVLLTANPQISRPGPTASCGILRLSGSCFYGSFGTAQNSLTVRYRACPEGGVFGEWTQLPTQIREDHTYSLELEVPELDYTKSYTLLVQVSDALDTVQEQLSLQPGIPVFHWKKDRFFFHVPVEFDSLVSGAYIRSYTVYGQQINLQLEPGQTVLLFGGGVCGAVNEAGTWWGSEGVTPLAEEGLLRLTFSQPIGGELLLLSGRPFTIE